MVTSAGEGVKICLKGTQRGHHQQVARARCSGVGGRLWDQ